MRKAPITFIDYSEDREDEFNYCLKCEKVNVKSKLMPRIYDDKKPLPYDWEEWLQCYKCGNIEHITLSRGEPMYGPAVEPPQGPYDQTGSNFESVSKRSKKKRISRDKQHNEDKDPDIAHEQRHGRQVNIHQ